MSDSITLPVPKKRTLLFSKDVDQESMEDLVKEILSINDSDEKLKIIYGAYGLEYTPQPIKIYIDSYGGQVYQCFGAVGVIEKSKTPIHTIVTGIAASSAFFILISGHKRFGYERSTSLYHQISLESGGTLAQVEEDIEEIKRLQKVGDDIVKKKTKITKKKMEENFKMKQDWSIDAKEALEFSIIDEII